jgi:TPP-dependent pyruvate/acetoin dehydrogenase alpha subunit
MVRPIPKQRSVTMPLARDPLPKTTSIQLYKSLFMARRSEEYIVKHYPENLMRTPMHMSMGQEFVPVGVCAALEGKADVFASYRSHAAFLAQTHDTDRFFSELYGRTSGTGEGKGGSMHLAAPDEGHILSSGVVATQIPVAVGAAFANRQLRTGRTAVVFFGDGAADAGVFWESINAAGLFRLPVIFVCEDNGYAVDTPREARQMASSISEAVKLFGAATYEDDSGDVESVYSLAKHAAEKAHHERRPAFLNIKCCRYLEHVGIGTDWNWGYRDQAAVERDWISRDAVKMQRARLASHQVSESAIAAIEEEIDKAIATSVRRAAEAPIPAPDRLHAGVFYEKA